MWAIEIKRGLSPKMEKGFRNGIENLKPIKAFIVYSGEEFYLIIEGVGVTGPMDTMKGNSRFVRTVYRGSGPLS